MRKCDECRFGMTNNVKNLPCGKYRKAMKYPKHKCSDGNFISFESAVSNITGESPYNVGYFDSNNFWASSEWKISYTIPEINKEPKKETIQKYEFKGNLDISLIVSDAIRENRRSFIIMAETNAVVGVLKNTFMSIDNIEEDVYIEADGNFCSNVFDMQPHSTHPYFLTIIDKKDVNAWLIKLQDEKRQFNNKMKNKKNKIRKKVKKGTNTGRRYKVFAI